MKKQALEAAMIGIASFVAFTGFISPFPAIHEESVRLAGLIAPSIYRGLADPLWTALVEGMAWLGCRPLAGWVSGLSALCVSAAIALLAMTVYRIPMARAKGAWRQEGDEGDARRFAGRFAAAALFAAPPVWAAATQPAPYALDLLLTVVLARGWVWAWTSYRGGPRRWVFAIWGAAIWEHPPLLAAAPLLAVGSVFHTARARLPWRGYLVDWAWALGVFAAVSAVVGLRAWFLPMLRWHEIESPAALVLHMMSAWRRGFSAAWPDTGWLLIGLLYFVPLVFLMREGSIPANRLERLILVAIVLLATAIGINAQIGGPGSPWRLSEDRPLLLAPHLAMSLWWSHLLAAAAYARHQRKRGPFAWWWNAAPVALLLCTIVHVGESAPAASLRAQGRILSSMVRSASERTIWLAGGRFDPVLRILARDARLDPLILNTALSESASYLRQLAASSSQEQSRILMELGLPAFLLSSWQRPGLLEQVAVFDVPAYWAAMLRVQAHAGPGWFHWSADPMDHADDAAWRELGAAIPDARAWTPRAGPYRAGALALAAYLRRVAEAHGDTEARARWEMPAPSPPRAVAPSARALREWKQAEELWREGRKDQARAAFERLHRAEPTLAVRALEYLLLLDYLEQRWTDANAHIRALAARAPSHPLLYWMRGQTLARAGRIDDAERAFRLSLELGETPLARHSLAALLSDRRAWAEALPHAERAVAMVPTHPAFLATRGTIYSFLGRAADAERDFEEAMRFGGGVVPAIPLNLAALKVAGGRVEEARALLEPLDPGSLSAADRAHFDDVRARIAGAGPR